MLFDLNGYLNSTTLRTAKALWPLFEAVVNSIQAIELSKNKTCGKIQIRAEREQLLQSEIDKRESLGRFESFSITDNGVGFTKENFESFQTACSTLKIKKGCKGLGRFTWLKTFRTVTISSNFEEDGEFYSRNFSFTTENEVSENGATPVKSDSNELSTTVCLNGYIERYKEAAPVELEVVAKKLIEHCLPFFISEQCPEITICDGASPILILNDYFDKNIKDSLHQDRFVIKNESFTIYHLRVPEGADAHKLHLCADMQEVDSVDLKNHIPDLQRKICTIDNSVGFYYVGYVTGTYLDSIVNSTRTGFEFDEKDDQTTLTGTGKATIIKTALEFIKGYLKDYLDDIKKKKHEQIDSFVADNHPIYRFMLKSDPEIYDTIPSGLKEEDLEMELHKQKQRWEAGIYRRGKDLEEAASQSAGDPSTTYNELFEQYWSGVTDLSKTYLAEYVTRRKAILRLLEDTLTIQDNGRFKKEDAIHSLICPMRHTSDDVDFEEMNLWIIDERMAYHKFLASDKTIKSLPYVDSRSTKEMDLAIFDTAFAYSDDDSPLNTITIIEFKKPDNQKDNPLSQIGKYIDEIVAGTKKRASGLSFGNCEKTSFRCFAICDLTPKMIAHCKDAGFEPTPDGMGYYGYQPGRNAYYEVISYSKLLADAKKRNQILFEKLFAPEIGKVIHIPEDNDSKPN